MQPDPRIVSILHRITDLLGEVQNGLRYLDEDGYEWIDTGDLRNELKRLGEAEEHPDLLDGYGYRWTWDGKGYRDVDFGRAGCECSKCFRTTREELETRRGPLTTEAPRVRS